MDRKAAPQTKNVVIEEGVVTEVYLSPGYTTSVRVPESISSVVVGNPLTFRAEHSESEPRLVFLKPITAKPTESNALITTASGQEISLHLISGGQTVPPSHVDFLVEFKRPQSLLIAQDRGQSLFVPETKSISTAGRSDSKPGRLEADPVAQILVLQKQRASPPWQGNTLQVSAGESLDVDHRTVLGFSVLNNSRQAIELLAPQIVLNGRSRSDKQIKAEPIGIAEYQITKRRLEPGERADGVVIFERPTFKESSETLELQVADSGQVNHPVQVPVPFVPTNTGGSQ
jgi:hypothetical protein